MEPEIRVELSGETLETQSPEDFNALIGELASKGLSVRVKRTQKAILAEAAARKVDNRPHFDPEKLSRLGEIGFNDFMGRLEAKGLRPSNAGSIWNVLADYSQGYIWSNPEDLPEDRKQIVVEKSGYRGPPRRERGQWEYRYFHVQNIREDNAQDLYAVDFQGLAIALEAGHFESKSKKPHIFQGIGVKGRQILASIVNEEIEQLPQSYQMEV